MLRAEGGATIDEIVAETGWQAHTVRGAISGALKKKLGLTITSEKVEGRGRAYMIAEDYRRTTTVPIPPSRMERRCL